MMHRDRPSWRLTTDAPRDLNFAIYVAASFGILPNGPDFSHERLWSAWRRDVDGDREILAHQWHAWWQSLVAPRAAKPFADKKGHPRRPPSRTGNHESLPTQLRDLCNEALPSYEAWWDMTAGGQQGVNYWAREHNFHATIAQVETELQRPVKPFRLTVDYVYCGLAQIIMASPTYAIMSVHQPSDTVWNSQWWLEKVRELA